MAERHKVLKWGKLRVEFESLEFEDEWFAKVPGTRITIVQSADGVLWEASCDLNVEGICGRSPQEALNILLYQMKLRATRIRKAVVASEQDSRIVVDNK